MHEYADINIRSSYWIGKKKKTHKHILHCRKYRNLSNDIQHEHTMFTRVKREAEFD